MKKLIYVFTLLFSLSASADDSKAVLVDQVLEQSSVKISIMNMPAQMAQIPAMMPVEAEYKQQFVQDMMIAMQSNFNEATVYNAVRQYFIDNGESAHLKQTLAWLQSPEGREATQIEILAGQQDMMAMQNYMMSFNPASLDADSLALYKGFLESSQLTEVMFNMMGKLMPKMMKALNKHGFIANEMSQMSDADIDAMLQQQLTTMRQQMAPMLEMQMLATISYMYKDLSPSSMAAYNQYLASDAGQHYLALAMDSVTDYGMDWAIDMMMDIFKAMDEAKLLEQ